MLAHEPRSKSERSGAGAVRQGILAAARQVISSHGVPRLTLEAVAAQAGISKGGLLYHFPTKDAMLQGMLLEHHCGILAICREQFLADGHKERPGRLHRAWIRSERIVSGMEDGLTMGDIAAIVTNPVLSQPLQEFWKGWGELLAGDGLDEGDSNLIQIALAGLKMVRTMGTCMESRQIEMLLGRLESIATPPEGYKNYDEACSWAVCAHDAWKGN
jgi:AcrR family transcriptional regulator